MKREVVIRLRAEHDIEEAHKWYAQIEPELGHGFLNEVSRVIQALAIGADRFSLYYREFRQILLPRFPYKLFYLLHNNRVVVVRVLHAKRDHLRHL